MAKNRYFEESDRTKRTREEWEKKQQERPEGYVSSWKPYVEAALEKLQNRKGFSYDPAGDALYRQYKDRYLGQGRAAMTEVSARAAAKTGGYGNSYGTAAAAQVYGGYMAELADKIPDLYALALEQYEAEGKKLKEDYELVSGREQAEKADYRQQISDWEKELARLEKTYTQSRDLDLELAQEASDTEKWQQELAEKKRQFDIRYGEQPASDAVSSGSSGKSGSTKPKTEEQKSEFDTLNLWLQNRKAAGTSREILIGKINDAYGRGKISRGEMLTLMGWYGTAATGTGGGRETAGAAMKNQNYLR